VTSALHLRTAREVGPVVVPGHSFRILADAASTGGRYSLTEAVSPVGAAVPPHAHDRSVECFYVLGGNYRLTVSGVVHEAAAGDFVLIPRGAAHQFEVIGEDEGRATVIFAPAGFEDVFRRMPEIFGTPGEPGPLWQQANAAYDTRLLDASQLTGGPPAVTAGSSGGALSTLGTTAMTGTPLEIRLCAGARDARFRLGPAVAAMWIVTGRFRVDLGGSEIIASAGQLVSVEADGPSRVTALALADRNEALVLTLEEDTR
jgi:quercetin dioxygenase-like cupin family protein